MLAVVIDYAVTTAGISGAGWLAVMLGGGGMIALVLSLLLLLLKPICEAFGGRTPGKALLGLRVVDLQHRPIGAWLSIVRNLVWVLGPGIGSFLVWLMLLGGIPGGVGGIGLAVVAQLAGLAWFIGCLPAFARDRRAFHDRFAGTIVLHGWTIAAVRTPKRRIARA